MAKGLFIPRTNSQLPAELCRKGTDLDVMITLAGDGDEAKSVFGFSTVVRTTRRMIKQNCSLYKPSRAEGRELNILCLSGEIDGTPFRGSQCFECRAGQFSKNGVFIGEIVAGGKPVEVAVEAAT